MNYQEPTQREMQHALDIMAPEVLERYRILTVHGQMLGVYFLEGFTVAMRSLASPPTL